MNSSFPNRWSFSYLKFTKYVTNIIAEPKYKYGQQEQVKVRNHNRSTPLERSIRGWGGGLKPVLRDPNTHQWIITGNKGQERVATDPGDPGVRNNTTGTLEQKKTNSWTPVGQATDKKLRPKPTKINSFMSGPSSSLTPDPPAWN